MPWQEISPFPSPFHSPLLCLKLRLCYLARTRLGIPTTRRERWTFRSRLFTCKFCVVQRRIRTRHESCAGQLETMPLLARCLLCMREMPTLFRSQIRDDFSINATFLARLLCLSRVFVRTTLHFDHYVIQILFVLYLIFPKKKKIYIPM